MLISHAVITSVGVISAACAVMMKSEKYGFNCSISFGGINGAPQVMMILSKGAKEGNPSNPSPKKNLIFDLKIFIKLSSPVSSSGLSSK